MTAAAKSQVGRWLWPLAGAQVVLTSLLGLWAIALAGAPKQALVVQAAAWLVGLVFASALMFRSWKPGPKAVLATAVVLFIALLASMGGPEIAGARRWIAAGPLTLHPASILLPLVLWAHASRPASWAVAGVLGASALLLAAQPDGAAALALLLGLIAIMATRKITAAEIVPVLCALGAAVWSWTRPDNLPAVAWVEQVAASAGAVSPIAGMLTLVLMSLTPLPFLLAAWKAKERGPHLALAGVWIGMVVANLAGNYPAPVLGYGASPVLGWMISLGLAALLTRRTAA